LAPCLWRCCNGEMFTLRATLTALLVLGGACANGADDTTEVLRSVETTVRQVVISTSEPLPTTPVGVGAETVSTTTTVDASTTLPPPTTTVAARSAAPSPEASSVNGDGVELIPPLVIVASTTTTVGTKAVPPPSTTVATSVTSETPGTTVRDSFVLALDSAGFASLTVTPGALVTFINNDDTAHTATSVTTNADERFNTGLVLPGSSASFTAPTRPGTYTFFSSEEAILSGVLTVSG